MKIFSLFVVVTLACESLFAGWYSSEFSTPSALVGFYLLMGLWAYCRAWVGLHLFAPRMPVIIFSGVMLATSALCCIMAILTGAVHLTIINGLANQLLADIYRPVYDLFGHATIALTALELLSLMTWMVQPNARGNRIADAMRGLVAVPRSEARCNLEAQG